MSVIHMAIAIPVIILSLFQMAILQTSLSVLLWEDDRNRWATYTRSTINSDEVAKEM